MKYLLLLALVAGCKDAGTKTRKKAESLLPASSFKHCVSEEGRDSNITICYNGANLVICTNDSDCMIVDVHNTTAPQEKAEQ